MTNGAHFEIAISDLKEHIKADKSIIQPWRNKAISRLEEAQAFIRMGVTSTNRTDLPSDSAEPVCICPDPKYAISKKCPVHGVQA